MICCSTFHSMIIHGAENQRTLIHKFHEIYAYMLLLCTVNYNYAVAVIANFPEEVIANVEVRETPTDITRL